MHLRVSTVMGESRFNRAARQTFREPFMVFQTVPSHGFPHFRRSNFAMALYFVITSSIEGMYFFIFLVLSMVC